MDDRPSEERLAAIERRLAGWWTPLRVALSPLVRLQVSGTVPDGPALLVANHATLLDPILLMLAIRRSIQWMGTETLLRAPVIGPLQAWIGTVPKTRFHSDVRAVWALRQWVQAGSVVGVFPEGERTWTGALQPFLPGIGRLVRLLGVPVVTARLHNHYRQWPRWTTHPRRATVAVEIDAPLALADRDEAAILAHLRDRLTVSPRSRPDLRVRALSTAQGLSNLIFACPTCDREALTEATWALHCACGERLSVDTLHWLTPRRGPPRRLETEVARLLAREAARFATHVGPGPILASVPVTLVDHTSAEARRPVAQGPLQLFRDRLQCGGLHLPLEDVLNANVEFQRTLEVRTVDRYLKATIRAGSAWRWPEAIRWWRQHG